MAGEIILDPLLPWPVLWAGAALALVLVALALWRGLPGWWLRGLSVLVLLGALAAPAIQREERRPLSDIVIVIADDSASQMLPGRPDQSAAALARITAEIAAQPNTEMRLIRVGDAADDGGTQMMMALATALAEEPRARVAGAILVTDGQIHDLALAPDMPAPVHVLLTGRASDWDRRLKIQTAPAFGIIGEPVKIQLMIEEQGRMPGTEKGRLVTVSIAIDGAAPESYSVPVNELLDLPLTLSHAGQNVVQFGLEVAPGELTDRNNVAVVQINGVRDRLRVLLISGEPHAGERTWRNLLKSDASVDLVHFTILRPPEKQDGVPVDELSLIAFPTRELFVDKIGEFDLIIFDRYKLRGILPAAYLANIRDYVMKGGAVLIAAGAEYATVESVFYSDLGPALPGAPTGRVLEQGYLPEVTDLGQRHPVTAGLEAFAPEGEGEGPHWGRWLRLVEIAEPRGQVVMSGAGGRPLLLLDRQGEGRVALIASDQAWLWSRGFEGGGPQLELLRRLAHWMMKEPELEEEALTAATEGQTLTITRRSLREGARSVTITAPDGSQTALELTETAPGRYSATWTAPEIGLYRLSDGEIERVVALGPAAPREFEETIATDAKVLPVIAPGQGGALRIEDGLPDIRAVRAGRVASGRGWLGITPREAYLTTDIRVTALMPAWAYLALAALFAIAAWLAEGRMRRARAAG